MPVIPWSGPAAAEARWRFRLRGLKHGSGEWVGDGLALSPPAVPRFSALSGCGLPPLSDSSWLIFFSKETNFVFISGVARVLQRQHVHYGHSRFIL